MLRNDNANWNSSEQREVVRLSLEAKTDVLVLLGTGYGKTMVTLIPMFMEKDSAIVIVLPLKSLITDYK